MSTPGWTSCEGGYPGQAGLRVVIRGGGVSPQARRMLDWAVVGSVVWTTVPAGPASVIAWRRPSSRAMVRQVWPVHPASLEDPADRGGSDAGAEFA